MSERVKRRFEEIGVVANPEELSSPPAAARMISGRPVRNQKQAPRLTLAGQIPDLPQEDDRSAGLVESGTIAAIAGDRDASSALRRSRARSGGSQDQDPAVDQTAACAVGDRTEANHAQPRRVKFKGEFRPGVSFDFDQGRPRARHARQEQPLSFHPDESDVSQPLIETLDDLGVDTLVVPDVGNVDDGAGGRAGRLVVTFACRPARGRARRG